MGNRNDPPRDEHDATWTALTHPEDWTNPAPESRYNLVVIGGGTAGLISAMGAAGLGGRVALIEKGRMGGDCLNWGCVPSKALISAARLAHQARRAADWGISTGPVTVDFPAVMARMRRLRAQIAHHDSFERVRSMGIDTYLGSARFTSPDTIDVAGQTLRFTRAVIATGASPYIPPISGVEEISALTNETLFQLTALPAHLIVVGGGPIGCEMAQTFRRLGARVTLLERAERLLLRDDPEAAALLQQQLTAEGVTIHLGAKIARFSREGDEKRVHLADDTAISGDAILLAVGRRANVTHLDLEEGNVEYDRRGVKVDDGLRSLTNPAVYAAGDVAGRWQFTHAADEMARIAIQNALFFGRRRLQDVVMPWATYTDPEVAHVGISPAEAAEREDVKAFTVPFSSVDRAILEGETDGFVRLYSNAAGDFLGGTIVGRGAGSMIGELSVALSGGLGMATLANSIHPYPTESNAIKQAGGIWNRTRLSPTAASVLQGLLRLRR